MTLRELLGTLRRHWPAALAAFLAFIALGVAAAFVPPLRYEATATLFVQPQPGNSSDSFGAVEAARFVLPALAEVVRTGTFRAGVRAELGDPRGADEPSLDAAPEAGTPVLRLSAEGRDPAMAERWANAAATELIRANPSTLVDIIVIDPARRPSEPSGPLRIPILAGTFVLGLIAALASSLALNVVRRRLSGSEGFRERFGVEVIGEIPRVRSFPATAGELLDASTDPAVLEAYQHLRTNFEILLLSKQPRAVAVMSYTAGEGKTSVVSNLAWSLARLGQTTIAVDGDLRNPALHRALGVEPGKGVTDVGPGVDALSLRRRTGTPELTFISSGQTERHPTEVISTAFPRLLGALEAPGRLVLIDSPPLLVAEATLIAVMAGTAVLVVDVARRDPDEVARALAELRQAGVDVLGVVLNRSHKRRRRDGSEYYYHFAREERPRAFPSRPGPRAGSRPVQSET